MQHVRQQVVLDEQLAPALGLGDALLAEVDVDPAGEQVLAVPVALAVAEQDERADHQGDGHARRRGMVGAMSITNDDIKTEWEPGDSLVVTMDGDADGTDGDGDATDGGGDTDGTDGDGGDADGGDA